jgi:glycosyltransferase involved in cell wall biosynthesis
MKTVAVIPAYMEEETIEEVVSRAAKHVDGVVVVDDGSVDSTAG